MLTESQAKFPATCTDSCMRHTMYAEQHALGGVHSLPCLHGACDCIWQIAQHSSTMFSRLDVSRPTQPVVYAGVYCAYP
jgi:hypothetical protein